jgi:hypothetical protein
MIASSLRLRFALGAMATFLLGATIARAEFHVAEPRVDIGEVKSGAPLAHEYAFTNTGSESLEIDEVLVSCGCQKPDFESRPYKPGESGKLRIEVNTLTQGAGPHAWRTTVRYRHGSEKHEQELLLTGTVVAEILVEPPQLVVFTDHAISHELRLIDQRTKALTITAVRTTSPKLTAQVTGEARDAQGHLTRDIRLDVGPDFPDGRYEETLSIYTDDPLYRHLKIPVTIAKRASQRFTALPNAVTLTASRGQPIPAKIVLIRDGNNEAVEIDRLTPSDPAIGCTWARGPGSNATLRISVDRARLQGDTLSGSVEVTISKPAADTITIPVTVTTP